jgi:putative hemolysin
MSELFVLIFLALINAFFAMSEIAIVQSSKPLLKKMAKDGSNRARIALELIDDKGRAFSTVQVGMTLIGILAGAYGGATIAANLTPWVESLPFVGKWAGQISLGLVVMLVTYLSVVIGELVPKRFALAHPEQLVLIAAYPMKIISKVGSPIVFILNTSANILLKVIGVNEDNVSNVTEEEVHAVLSEGAESGAIEASEYEMMRRVIALGDREVKTIMTPRVDIVTLDITDDLNAVRKTINESGHSRFLVVENSLDNLKGVVVAKEILEHALCDGSFNFASMIQEVLHLSENAPCQKALELFKDHPINFAIVIDEYGSVEGIVTASDILEAIVGSIASNYEDNQHNIVQREDGSWLVDGTTVTDEIVLTLGIEIDELENEDLYNTLAGFIMHQTGGTTPQVGESLEALGYRFEVMDLDGRRIDKVLITKIEPEIAENETVQAGS